MKLWHKLFIITIIIWVTFFLSITLIVYPLLPWAYLIVINLFGLICWLGTITILKRMVTDRLQRLQHNTLSAKMHNSFKKFTPNKKDEIATINSQVNLLNKELLLLEEKLTSHWNSPLPISLADTEAQSDKERLAKLAHYDLLTTLPNRIFFNEMLNKSLHHAARQNKRLAIMFIDIDHFKQVNDALGYKKADAVLRKIANDYTSVLRSGDIIARLGGDEFVVLLNDIEHPKFASTIADKLLQVTNQPIVFEKNTFSISASIGICIYPDDGNALEILQKNADVALYKAKCVGGGTYQYYTHEMTLEANKHVTLDKALRKAINNEEFVLHYQPKLHLHTGTVKGVEALIRWNHPELGLINPNEFIPQAEEIGLSMQIGTWALYTACRAAKLWQEQGFASISVAVNLSPQQFLHSNLVKSIDTALRETQINPSLLELEITENTIIEDINLTLEKLNSIKKLGVKVCLDDFGTGYTSINFLKKFPIDVLKIDQSFIKGIPDDPNDMAITSAIIALGKNLGMEVVAEGVETLQQLDFLTEHQCHFIQGYYFSRPLPEAKLILQLKKQAR